jgi:uncharacterized protein YbaR (Trm112 family)
MSKIVYCWYCDRRLEFDGVKEDKIMLICPECKLRVYIREEGEKNDQANEIKK